MSEGIEARRAQIIDAALGTFTRYGYRRTSMETIAQAAGVSRPALYQHFTGKREVFRAGIVHMLDTAGTLAETAARAEGTVEDRVYDVLATKIDLVIGHVEAEFRSELLAEATAIAGDLLESHKERITGAVASVLSSAAGELRQLDNELSVRDAAVLLLYAATGIELEHATAEAAHIRLRQLVNVMIRGLRAH